jgi:prepilin-type processing-associated H-X9-DG protein
MNFWLGFNWKTYMSLPSDKANDLMAQNEYSLKLTQVMRPGKCFAFAEENLWMIQIALGDKWNYSGAVLNDNSLWTNPIAGKYTDNIATYHKVAKSKRNEGFSNVVFIDGHVSTMKGKPEQEAYLDYGIPYKGHNTEVRSIW